MLLLPIQDKRLAEIAYMKNKTYRHAILVAGMHRSGTSALARVVNLLGADIGSCLLPAVHGDNDRGYWEQQDVVALNEACLAHFYRSWDNVRSLPDGWTRDPWLQEWRSDAAAALRRHFDGSSLCVIKDPRISRLLPVWLPVLEDLGIQAHVLVMMRHPLEVAASLLARAGNTLSAADAHRLWIRYTIDVETGSRNCSRSWVHYESLLGNWRDELPKIAKEFALSWRVSIDSAASEIETFLNTGLQHQRAVQQIADLDCNVSKRSCALYADLVACQGKESAKSAIVDRARQHLDQELECGETQESAAAPSEATSLATPPLALDIWTPSALLRLRSRLYFRRDPEGYDSYRSVDVEAKISGVGARALFVLPEGAAADFIRFDPSDMGGIYRLIGIRVNNTDIARGHERVSAVHERELEVTGKEWVRFATTGSDPWVEVDLRNLAAETGTPRTIEIYFQREAVLEMLHHQFRQREREFSELEQLLIAELDRIGKHVEAASRQIESASNVAYAAYLAQRANRRVMRKATGLALETADYSHVKLLAQYPDFKPKIWCVNGDDPRFSLQWPGQKKPLPAGWYVLDMVLRPLTGQLINPLLYVDYGDGFNESKAIPLALSDNLERHHLLVRLTQPVHALRLDPTHVGTPCDFLFAPPNLRHISHIEAFLRVAVPAVRKARAQGASWLGVLKKMWASLRGNPDQLLERLYANTNAAEGTHRGISYTEWIKANDTLDANERTQILARIEEMEDPPFLSVILPVYNPGERWLRACLDSVSAQLYRHWELCIADDASTASHVRIVLEEYAASDSRIKLVFRGRNGHISAASNSALDLATGDFIALLDHDDELPEHALYHVAEVILAHPDVGMVYSDEDKIDEAGIRFDPYLKTDWNPELFCGHNMFSHLGVYRRSLVVEVGGFREGYEGSQDYDLALRCSERLNRAQIRHISRVLYHWRAIVGSTALGPQEKSYAHNAARKAISAHFQRVCVDADVLPIKHRAGNWRIHRTLPNPVPSVSIIIPTRNEYDALRCCIDSILERSTYTNFKIFVVDNRSDEPRVLLYLDRLRKLKNVDVSSFDEPFNFSRLNNVAATRADGDVLLFLNNDTEVITPTWLEEIVPLAMQEGAGAIGTMLYYPDDTIQHAGIVLGLGAERIAGHAYHLMHRGFPGDKCRAHLVQEMSAVTGACMAIRRDRFNAVQGFDETLKVAFNDVDLCLRLNEKGFHNLWTPNAELYHHESLTRGADTDPERRAAYLGACAQMRERWGNRLLNDPYYHPAFSLDRADFMTWVEPRRTSVT